MYLLVIIIVILLAVILNYVMPSGVFVLVTSVATTCFLFIWSMIVLAHLRYKKTIQGRSEHPFKMPLYPLSDYLVLAFMAFIAVVLLFQPDTRQALLFAPVWFIFLLLVYRFKFAKSMVHVKQTEE